MGRVCLVFPWLLIVFGVVAAQVESPQRGLPNWLTGIVAVAVFLFLIFVAFLINKAWCPANKREANVEINIEEDGMEDDVMEDRTTHEYDTVNGSTYDSTIHVAQDDVYEKTLWATKGIAGTEEKVTSM